MEESNPGLLKFVRNSKLLSEKDCEEMGQLHSGIQDALRIAKTQFQKLTEKEPKLVLPDVDALRGRVEAYVAARKASDRVFTKWKKMRLENIELLRSIGQSLEYEKEIYIIPRVLGRTYSVLGGAVNVIALAAAPFTLGASAGLGVLGTVFMGIGTTAAYGANLVEAGRLSSFMKQVHKKLKEEEDSYKLIISMFDRQEEMLNNLKEILHLTTRGFFGDVWKSIKQATVTLGAAQVAASGITEKLLPLLQLNLPEAWLFEMTSVLLVSSYLLRKNNLAFDLVSTVGKVALYNAAKIVEGGIMFAGGTAGAKLLSKKFVLQGVLASVSIVMDSIAIAEIIKDIKEGCPSKEGKELHKAADYLLEEFKEIEKLYK